MITVLTVVVLVSPAVTTSAARDDDSSQPGISITSFDMITSVHLYTYTVMANIEFRVPYSQRYLFNAIPDTNHNANPTNSNRNSKGNPNPTNPINPTNPTNPNTIPLWIWHPKLNVCLRMIIVHFADSH